MHCSLLYIKKNSIKYAHLIEKLLLFCCLINIQYNHLKHSYKIDNQNSNYINFITNMSSNNNQNISIVNQAPPPGSA